MKSYQLSKISKKLFVIILIISLFSGCKKSVEEQNELAQAKFVKVQELFKLQDETGKLIVKSEENLQQKEKWLKNILKYMEMCGQKLMII